MKTLAFLSLALLLSLSTAVAQSSTAAVAAKTPVELKIDTVIFPRVEFRNATLDEAVEFLRIKGADIDTATSDPVRKGVNIVVMHTAKPTDPKITLSLTDVPLVSSLHDGGAVKLRPGTRL